MSREVNSSAEANQPLHPALRCLARAVVAYRRSGFRKDEEAFSNWAICHFDQDDYERAFSEITALPEWKSDEVDYQYAEEVLKKVRPELEKKRLAGDTVDLWLEEIREYGRRRKQKRNREAERAEGWYARRDDLEQNVRKGPGGDLNAAPSHEEACLREASAGETHMPLDDEGCLHL